MPERGLQAVLARSLGLQARLGLALLLWRPERDAAQTRLPWRPAVYVLLLQQQEEAQMAAVPMVHPCSEVSMHPGWAVGPGSGRSAPASGGMGVLPAAR
jgi:hypothetical protein